MLLDLPSSYLLNTRRFLWLPSEPELDLADHSRSFVGQSHELIELTRTKARYYAIPLKDEEDGNVDEKTSQDGNEAIFRVFAGRWVPKRDDREYEEEVAEHHQETAPSTVLNFDDCETIGRVHGAPQNLYSRLVIEVMKGAVEQSEYAPFVFHVTVPYQHKSINHQASPICVLDQHGIVEDALTGRHRSGSLPHCHSSSLFAADQPH